MEGCCGAKVGRRNRLVQLKWPVEESIYKYDLQLLRCVWTRVTLVNSSSGGALRGQCGQEEQVSSLEVASGIDTLIRLTFTWLYIYNSVDG